MTVINASRYPAWRTAAGVILLFIVLVSRYSIVIHRHADLSSHNTCLICAATAQTEGKTEAVSSEVLIVPLGPVAFAPAECPRSMHGVLTIPVRAPPAA